MNIRAELGEYFANNTNCVLFYLIVLYGCVCQPLINGYDDDDVED